MSKEQKLSYQEAFKELEKIVKDIEHESINVDELSEKVKRATILINICREKLKSTEKDVNQIIKDIDAD